MQHQPLFPPKSVAVEGIPGMIAGCPDTISAYVLPKRNTESWKSKPIPKWCEEDLNDCARWWADNLGLQSWRISAVFKDISRSDGTMGHCRFSGAYEFANITLASWKSRDESDPLEADMEACVVHELVHARLHAFDQCDMDDPSVQHHMQEQAVDRIARALVTQRRHQSN